MNKENMQKLINAIKTNEKSHFNMSKFFGTTSNHDHDNVYALDVQNLPVFESDIGKDIFDCGTTCCIAGFATALANDWKVSKTLVNLSGNRTDSDLLAAIPDVNYIENVSNEYLGLSYTEGRNLYFGEHNSIWKFLKFNYDYFFNMKLSEVDEEDGEDDYEYQWDPDYGIDLNSITPLMAIKALKMLIDGEIVLSDGNGNAGFKDSEEFEDTKEELD